MEVGVWEGADRNELTAKFEYEIGSVVSSLSK